MISLFNVVVRLGLIVSVVIVVSSCARPMNYVGQTVMEEQRIALKESKGESNVWQTNDVTLHYGVTENGEFLTVSGHLEVSDGVLYTFPVVNRFTLTVYLLDENGQAMSKHDISPLFSHHMTFPDKVSFSRKVPKGVGVTSLAFGYWGVFEEGNSTIRRRSSDWEIFHNPFSKR